MTLAQCEACGGPAWLGHVCGRLIVGPSVCGRCGERIETGIHSCRILGSFCCGCVTYQNGHVEACNRTPCLRLHPLDYVTHLVEQAQAGAAPEKVPVRTVCADCRWYRAGMNPTTWTHEYLCHHANARSLVTGDSTRCADRNDGKCADFQAKEKP